MKTYKHLYPELTTDEYIKKLTDKLEVLDKQLKDPNDTTCKHCINLSWLETYNELKELGHYDNID